MNNTQNAMMQTIQCKLFSYNINNYNGTYFLMRQKNTKVLLVKGNTHVQTTGRTKLLEPNRIFNPDTPHSPSDFKTKIAKK